jgi:hypothetical protein
MGMEWESVAVPPCGASTDRFNWFASTSAMDFPYKVDAIHAIYKSGGHAI